jgi:peptide/nickel transport system substrate-binding protein
LPRRRAVTIGLLAAPALLSRRARAATPADTAVMAQRIDDIGSFDPAQSYEFSNNEVDSNCYQRLVAPDPADGTKLVGDAAESWEIAEDARSFTFHLRGDARFESGRTLSAADAAFSLARAVRLDGAPGFILTQFGYTPDNVDKLIRATDDTTLVMDLPQPAAPGFLLHCLSANVGGIVDRAEALAHAKADDLGSGWLKTRTAGSGPYRLRGFEASDYVSLDRNPHAAAPGRLARVFIRHIPDPSAQLLLLERGDVDIARDLNADQLGALEGVAGASIVSAPQATSLYIAMNQDHPLLRRPQVIAAIKWALDLDSIARNLTPRTYEVCQSFLPSCLPDAITDRPYHQDRARAAALLAEAGLTQGFDITLDYVAHSPDLEIAQVIQADLAAIGIRVRLLGGDQKQIISKTRYRRHELVLMGWGADYFDPNSNAQAFCENPDDTEASHLKIIAWRSHYVDAALGQQSREAAAQTDPARRSAAYAALQRDFMARAPFAMLLQGNAVAAMGAGISGLRLGALADYTRYATLQKT